MATHSNILAWRIPGMGEPGRLPSMGLHRVGHDWSDLAAAAAAAADSILKSRDIINKGPSSQSYGFSSRHVRKWELNLKEGWALKNWCFLTEGLEKTLESPLDCKEIQPVKSKGNQSWIVIGRTDAEAETPILWPPDVTNWLIWKDPDAGKDCRQAGREGDNRVWDGWRASLTWWTWVWASSKSWWWTGKPGVLQSMGSQRVGHNWMTEMNWTDQV